LSAADFDLDLPFDTKRQLLNKALYSVAEQGALSPEKIRAQVCREEKAYEAKGLSEYILWSSLSVMAPTNAGVIRLGVCRTFGSSRDARSDFAAPSEN
jgi:hypothetical protein